MPIGLGNFVGGFGSSLGRGMQLLWAERKRQKRIEDQQAHDKAMAELSSTLSEGRQKEMIDYEATKAREKYDSGGLADIERAFGLDTERMESEAKYGEGGTYSQKAAADLDADQRQWEAIYGEGGRADMQGEADRRNREAGFGLDQVEAEAKLLQKIREEKVLQSRGLGRYSNSGPGTDEYTKYFQRALGQSDAERLSRQADIPLDAMLAKNKLSQKLQEEEALKNGLFGRYYNSGGEVDEYSKAYNKTLGESEALKQAWSGPKTEYVTRGLLKNLDNEAQLIQQSMIDPLTGRHWQSSPNPIPVETQPGGFWLENQQRAQSKAALKDAELTRRGEIDLTKMGAKEAVTAKKASEKFLRIFDIDGPEAASDYLKEIYKNGIISGEEYDAAVKAYLTNKND